MTTSLTYQLKAAGKKGLPRVIQHQNTRYYRTKLYKNDFFAATALYTASADSPGRPGKLVLKTGRRGDFLGLPLGWLGRLLVEHESHILQKLQHIRNIPRYMGRYTQHGFMYQFIEGRSLDETPHLPDDFFDRLEQVLRQVHQAGIAYIDLNKRGNILLGEDSRPYLIDFQISLHIEWPRPFRRIGQWLLAHLQQEDIYHLLKHKRRFARHLMNEEALAASRRQSRWIRLHRTLSRPLTAFRRQILARLYRSGHLNMDDINHHVPENDPDRW